jgi:hypothetical protein
MKRILCSLLVATLPGGSVHTHVPKSKNAKITLVYQHELPGDRHGVSASASQAKPARLLAVFMVDTNETELTI